MITDLYDGAAVVHGHEGGVNVKIKEKYRNDYYVYCYAHKLNKLLELAVSYNKHKNVF